MRCEGPGAINVTCSKCGGVVFLQEKMVIILQGKTGAKVVPLEEVPRYRCVECNEVKEGLFD